MVSIIIVMATRGMPPTHWAIRCNNHDAGYKPLMSYDALPDRFVCACGSIVKVDSIYWSLPEPPKGIG